jgi:lipopolysaccharide/colanic/teichoic acid biosynthesis glycosyltransferase
VARRTLDLLLAGLGVLLLAPLLLAIAVWVRLDSRGPVLFRQERVGRGGRVFRIRKFRTMVADAERHAAAGPAQVTVAGDARITRAGAVLRRHKLDELPQLLDVLQGTMSLVGPRPEVPRWVAEWPADLRETVLSVRPGITDPASLAYVDEAELLACSPDPERTYREQLMPRKLALASAYVRERTLAGDLRLIGATLVRLVGR